jgi:hypothetical protein
MSRPPPAQVWSYDPWQIQRNLKAKQIRSSGPSPSPWKPKETARRSQVDYHGRNGGRAKKTILDCEACVAPGDTVRHGQVKGVPALPPT